ncbi:LPXTG cell wall anchor domain-containing protein [Micromonospora chokoriensis]|uniref:LPXTG-motif cell wall anchor domain-containing protein n=1 Tax=Micromonospora chokoriensis TaxID=356851 RepID=A0A1C4V9C7_9ACTN|nr:LPXTG cell wall anchor domain-containing protein [Micromonospora chokoriensis]SCE80644.1 LPXTG-motif cell wall anchor domain-containing protein [Micromonospora chokoriensis]
MRWKIPAGALIALAFLVPAAPAAAQFESPGKDAACQTVERKVYQDVRKIVAVDLDTPTDQEIRVLTAQLLHWAKVDKLAGLQDTVEQRLKGTPEELRAFLKKGVPNVWTTDLRIKVNQSMTGAGVNVKKAAQVTLDNGSADALLAYLNDGVYTARELDCASQPTPTPSASPSVTPSATPSTTPTGAATPTASASLGAGGEGGGLPKTGANTAIVASVGAVLLLLGGIGFLIGRRRRSRFVA